LLASPDLANWLSTGGVAKHWKQKILWLLKCPIKALAPIIALQHGLTDPTNGLIMGKTAQEIAYRYHLSREEMDQYALQSHHKAHDAWEKGEMKEVMTLIGPQGTPILRDDGIRPDLSLMKLSQLKPVFEKYGSITAGNSSQLTDGAGALLLATEAFIEKYQLTPLGIIRSVAWNGCDPRMMGLGPVGSMTKILTQEKLSFEDLDCIEINEAFSAQVLGVVKSFSDSSLGSQFCHIDDRYGDLPLAKLNRWGGAIALGHPIAASGLRLVIRALTALRDHKEKRALVSLCIGGGQGGAALVESI
jgi:acetyl-CoA C-acetyltransferase